MKRLKAIALIACLSLAVPVKAADGHMESPGVAAPSPVIIELVQVIAPYLP